MNFEVCLGTSPLNFMEVFSFVVIDGALNTMEVSVMVIVHDGRYFEVPHQTIRTYKTRLRLNA